eukprot:TRINITY_DN2923_c0_g1_i1.p1 TRINITY_DN2923_c0_g1~~TRINITY_DN2923_c0_g1_i1.p1  ORF type:complete len:477 (+),score=101.09 TRINITY_DN2923_c0_g1_i1:52-1482(+)
MPSHMWPASQFSSTRHVSPPRRDVSHQQISSRDGIRRYQVGVGAGAGVGVSAPHQLNTNRDRDRDNQDLLQMIASLQQEKDGLRKQALEMRVALQKSQNMITQMGKQQQQQQQQQRPSNEELAQTNPWLASLVGQKTTAPSQGYTSLENELRELDSAPQSDWVARGRKAEIQRQLNQQQISSSATTNFMGGNSRSISTQTNDDEPLLFGNIPITLGSLYAFHEPSMTQPINVGAEEGADVCIDMRPSTVVSLQKQVSELTLKCTQLTCELAAVRTNNPLSYKNKRSEGKRTSSHSDQSQNEVRQPTRKGSNASTAPSTHSSSSSKHQPQQQLPLATGVEGRGRSDSQNKNQLPIVREETPVPETVAPVPTKQETPPPPPPEEPEEMVRIGLVGDDWPCPDGAARPSVVCSIPKNKPIKSSFGLLQENLGIDDLSPYSLYRNASSLPNFSPGDRIDENRSPADIGFDVRGLIVVTKK